MKKKTGLQFAGLIIMAVLVVMSASLAQKNLENRSSAKMSAEDKKAKYDALDAKKTERKEAAEEVKLSAYDIKQQAEAAAKAAEAALKAGPTKATAFSNRDACLAEKGSKFCDGYFPVVPTADPAATGMTGGCSSDLQCKTAGADASCYCTKTGCVCGGIGAVGVTKFQLQPTTGAKIEPTAKVKIDDGMITPTGVGTSSISSVITPAKSGPTYGCVAGNLGTSCTCANGMPGQTIRSANCSTTCSNCAEPIATAVPAPNVTAATGNIPAGGCVAGNLGTSCTCANGMPGQTIRSANCSTTCSNCAVPVATSVPVASGASPANSQNVTGAVAKFYKSDKECSDAHPGQSHCYATAGGCICGEVGAAAKFAYGWVPPAPTSVTNSPAVSTQSEFDKTVAIQEPIASAVMNGDKTSLVALCKQQSVGAAASSCNSMSLENLILGYLPLYKDSVAKIADSYKQISTQMPVVNDLLKGDKTSLIQKCKDSYGIGNPSASSCEGMSVESLVKAYLPAYKDKADQLGALIKQNQVASEFLSKSDSQLRQEKCGAGMSVDRCDELISGGLLKAAGITSDQVAKLVTQKDAATIITKYQYGEVSSDAELMASCKSMGGSSCTSKSAALGSIAKLTGNTSLTVAVVEEGRAKVQKENDAYSRVAGTLTNLGSIDEIKKQVAAGTNSWTEVEAGIADLRKDALTNVIMSWNDFTAGRFKRGNDLLMEGVSQAGPDATLFGGAIVNPLILNNMALKATGSLLTGNTDALKRQIDATQKIISGSLAQGGDAAMVAVAIVGAPLAPGVGAYLGTGLGVAATTQMLGTAADTCELAKQGKATQKDCNVSIAMAAVSGAGTALGVAAQASQLVQTGAKVSALTKAVGAAAAGSKVIKGVEMAVDTVGVVTFTTMAIDTCSAEEVTALDCASSAAMAGASGMKLIGNIGGVVAKAAQAEKALAGATKTGEVVAQKVHTVSADLFAASACSKLLESGSAKTTDSISMCMFGLSGSAQAHGQPLISAIDNKLAGKEVILPPGTSEKMATPGQAEALKMVEKAAADLAKAQSELKGWENMEKASQNEGGNVPDSVNRGLENAQVAADAAKVARDAAVENLNRATNEAAAPKPETRTPANEPPPPPDTRTAWEKIRDGLGSAFGNKTPVPPPAVKNEPVAASPEQAAAFSQKIAEMNAAPKVERKVLSEDVVKTVTGDGSQAKGESVKVMGELGKGGQKVEIATLQEAHEKLTTARELARLENVPESGRTAEQTRRLNELKANKELGNLDKLVTDYNQALDKVREVVLGDKQNGLQRMNEIQEGLQKVDILTEISTLQQKIAIEKAKGATADVKAISTMERNVTDLVAKKEIVIPSGDFISETARMKLTDLIRDTEHRLAILEDGARSSRSNQIDTLEKLLSGNRVGVELTTAGGKTMVGAMVLKARAEIFGNETGVYVSKEGSQNAIRSQIDKMTATGEKVVVLDVQRLGEAGYVKELLSAKYIVTGPNDVNFLRNNYLDLEHPAHSASVSVIEKMTKNVGVYYDEAQLTLDPNMAGVNQKGAKAVASASKNQAAADVAGILLKEQILTAGDPQAHQSWKGKGALDIRVTSVDGVVVDVARFNAEAEAAINSQLRTKNAHGGEFFDKVSENRTRVEELAKIGNPESRAEIKRLTGVDDLPAINLVLDQLSMVNTYAKSLEVEYKRAVDNKLLAQGETRYQKEVSIPVNNGVRSEGQTFSGDMNLTMEHVGAIREGKVAETTGLSTTSNKAYKSTMPDFMAMVAADGRNGQMAVTGTLGGNKGVVETALNMIVYSNSDAIVKIVNTVDAGNGKLINQENGHAVADVRDSLKLVTDAVGSGRLNGENGGANGNLKLAYSLKNLDGIEVARAVWEGKKSSGQPEAKYFVKEGGDTYYEVKFDANGKVESRILTTAEAIQQRYQNGENNLVTVIDRGGATGDSIKTPESVPFVPISFEGDPTYSVAQLGARGNRGNAVDMETFAIVVGGTSQKLPSGGSSAERIAAANGSFDFNSWRKTIEQHELQINGNNTSKVLNSRVEAQSQAPMADLINGKVSKNISEWASKNLLEKFLSGEQSRDLSVKDTLQESISKRNEIAKAETERWKSIFEDPANKTILDQIKKESPATYARMEANRDFLIKHPRGYEYAEGSVVAPQGKDTFLTAGDMGAGAEAHKQTVLATSESKYVGATENPDVVATSQTNNNNNSPPPAPKVDLGNLNVAQGYGIDGKFSIGNWAAEKVGNVSASKQSIANLRADIITGRISNITDAVNRINQIPGLSDEQRRQIIDGPVVSVLPPKSNLAEETPAETVATKTDNTQKEYEDAVSAAKAAGVVDIPERYKTKAGVEYWVNIALEAKKREEEAAAKKAGVAALAPKAGSGVRSVKEAEAKWLGMGVFGGATMTEWDAYVNEVETKKQAVIAEIRKSEATYDPSDKSVYDLVRHRDSLTKVVEPTEREKIIAEAQKKFGNNFNINGTNTQISDRMALAQEARDLYGSTFDVSGDTASIRAKMASAEITKKLTDEVANFGEVFVGNLARAKDLLERAKIGGVDARNLSDKIEKLNKEIADYNAAKVEGIKAGLSAMAISKAQNAGEIRALISDKQKQDAINDQATQRASQEELAKRQAQEKADELAQRQKDEAQKQRELDAAKITAELEKAIQEGVDIGLKREDLAKIKSVSMVRKLVELEKQEIEAARTAEQLAKVTKDLNGKAKELGTKRDGDEPNDVLALRLKEIQAEYDQLPRLDGENYTAYQNRKRQIAKLNELRDQLDQKYEMNDAEKTKLTAADSKQALVDLEKEVVKRVALEKAEADRLASVNQLKEQLGQRYQLNDAEKTKLTAADSKQALVDLEKEVVKRIALEKAEADRLASVNQLKEQLGQRYQLNEDEKKLLAAAVYKKDLISLEKAVVKRMALEKAEIEKQKKLADKAGVVLPEDVADGKAQGIADFVAERLEALRKDAIEAGVDAVAVAKLKTVAAISAAKETKLVEKAVEALRAGHTVDLFENQALNNARTVADVKDVETTVLARETREKEAAAKLAADKLLEENETAKVAPIDKGQLTMESLLSLEARLTAEQQTRIAAIALEVEKAQRVLNEARNKNLEKYQRVAGAKAAELEEVDRLLANGNHLEAISEQVYQVRAATNGVIGSLDGLFSESNNTVFAGVNDNLDSILRRRGFLIDSLVAMRNELSKKTALTGRGATELDELDTRIEEKLAVINEMLNSMQERVDYYFANKEDLKYEHIALRGVTDNVRDYNDNLRLALESIAAYAEEKVKIMEKLDQELGLDNNEINLAEAKLEEAKAKLTRETNTLRVIAEDFSEAKVFGIDTSKLINFGQVTALVKAARSKLEAEALANGVSYVFRDSATVIADLAKAKAELGGWGDKGRILGIFRKASPSESVGDFVTRVKKAIADVEDKASRGILIGENESYTAFIDRVNSLLTARLRADTDYHVTYDNSDTAEIIYLRIKIKELDREGNYKSQILEGYKSELEALEKEFRTYSESQGNLASKITTIKKQAAQVVTLFNNVASRERSIRENIRSNDVPQWRNELANVVRGLNKTRASLNSNLSEFGLPEMTDYSTFNDSSSLNWLVDKLDARSGIWRRGSTPEMGRLRQNITQYMIDNRYDENRILEWRTLVGQYEVLIISGEIESRNSNVETTVRLKTAEYTRKIERARVRWSDANREFNDQLEKRRQLNSEVISQKLKVADNLRRLAVGMGIPLIGNETADELIAKMTEVRLQKLRMTQEEIDAQNGQRKAKALALGLDENATNEAVENAIRQLLVRAERLHIVTGVNDRSAESLAALMALVEAGEVKNKEFEEILAKEKRINTQMADAWKVQIDKADKLIGQNETLGKAVIETLGWSQIDKWDNVMAAVMESDSEKSFVGVDYEKLNATLRKFIRSQLLAKNLDLSGSQLDKIVGVLVARLTPIAEAEGLKLALIKQSATRQYGLTEVELKDLDYNGVVKKIDEVSSAIKEMQKEIESLIDGAKIWKMGDSLQKAKDSFNKYKEQYQTDIERAIEFFGLGDGAGAKEVNEEIDKIFDEAKELGIKFNSSDRSFVNVVDVHHDIARKVFAEATRLDIEYDWTQDSMEYITALKIKIEEKKKMDLFMASLPRSVESVKLAELIVKYAAMDTPENWMKTYQVIARFRSTETSFGFSLDQANLDNSIIEFLKNNLLSNIQSLTVEEGAGLAKDVFGILRKELLAKAKQDFQLALNEKAKALGIKGAVDEKTIQSGIEELFKTAKSLGVSFDDKNISPAGLKSVKESVDLELTRIRLENEAYLADWGVKLKVGDNLNEAVARIKDDVADWGTTDIVRAAGESYEQLKKRIDDLFSSSLPIENTTITTDADAVAFWLTPSVAGNVLGVRIENIATHMVTYDTDSKKFAIKMIGNGNNVREAVSINGQQILVPFDQDLSPGDVLTFPGKDGSLVTIKYHGTRKSQLDNGIPIIIPLFTKVNGDVLGAEQAEALGIHSNASEAEIKSAIYLLFARAKVLSWVIDEKDMSAKTISDLVTKVNEEEAWRFLESLIPGRRGVIDEVSRMAGVWKIVYDKNNFNVIGAKRVMELIQAREALVKNDMKAITDKLGIKLNLSNLSSDELVEVEKFTKRLTRFNNFDDLMDGILSNLYDIDDANSVTLSIADILGVNSNKPAELTPVYKLISRTIKGSINNVMYKEMDSGVIVNMEIPGFNVPLTTRKRADGTYYVSGKALDMLEISDFVLAENTTVRIKNKNSGDQYYLKMKDGKPKLIQVIAIGGKEIPLEITGKGMEIDVTGLKIKESVGVTKNGNRWVLIPGSRITIVNDNGEVQSLYVVKEYTVSSKSDANGILNTKITSEVIKTKMIGDVFDAELELARIENLRGQVSISEIRKQMVEYTKKLRWQQEGLGTWRKSAEDFIRKKPNSSSADILAFYVDFEKTYKLPSKYRDITKKVFEAYSTKHRAVVVSTTKYLMPGGKYNGKAMFKDFFGVEATGEVEVVVGPMTISIRPHNNDDYANAYNWDQKKTGCGGTCISEEDKKSSLSSGGRAFPSVNVPGLESIVFIARGDQPFKRVYDHEEKHQINKLFFTYSLNLTKADSEKGAVETANAMLALSFGVAKDEILAYFGDPTETSDSIKSTLARTKVDGGLYDYFAIFLSGIGDYAEAGWQSLLVKQLKGKIPYRNKVYDESISAFSRLEKLLGRKGASAVLETEPLTRWRTVVDRLVSQNVLLLRALKLSEKASVGEVNSAIKKLVGQARAAGVVISDVGVVSDYRTVARIQEVISRRELYIKAHESGTDDELTFAKTARDKAIKALEQVMQENQANISSGNASYYRPDGCSVCKIKLDTVDLNVSVAEDKNIGGDVAGAMASVEDAAAVLDHPFANKPVEGVLQVRIAQEKYLISGLDSDRTAAITLAEKAAGAIEVALMTKDLTAEAIGELNGYKAEMLAISAVTVVPGVAGYLQGSERMPNERVVAMVDRIANRYSVGTGPKRKGKAVQVFTVDRLTMAKLIKYYLVTVHGKVLDDEKTDSFGHQAVTLNIEGKNIILMRSDIPASSTDELLEHELIHAMVTDLKSGNSGFSHADGLGRDLNEAVVQLLTLMDEYNLNDPYVLRNKIMSGEIVTPYLTQVANLCVVMLGTRADKPYTVMDLAKLYFNNSINPGQKAANLQMDIYLRLPEKVAGMDNFRDQVMNVLLTKLMKIKSSASYMQDEMSASEKFESSLKDLVAISETDMIVTEIFSDPQFVAVLPKSISDNPKLMEEYRINTSKFHNLAKTHPEMVYKEEVSEKEITLSNGLKRPEQSGKRIDVLALAAQGIDLGKVIVFRVTSEGDVKPEDYWTTDFYQVVKGLNVELAKKSTNPENYSVLMSTLADISSDTILIRDVNDDNGIAVMRLGNKKYLLGRVLAVIPLENIDLDSGMDFMFGGR